MANYPISKMNTEGTLLRPKSSYCTDEYAEKMCDLYLRDEIHKDEHGKLHKHYRLHAKQSHNIEMAFDACKPLSVMRQCNIRLMDFRSAWNTNITQMNEHQIREIILMAQGQGIDITCIATPIGKEALDAPMKDVAERARQGAKLAHLCGCKYIRCFSFYRQAAAEEDALSIAIERLGALAEMAKEEAVVLLMENAAPTVGSRGDLCAKILGTINSPYLRLAYDCAAFVSAGEKPFDESFPKVEPFIEYVHIKDCKRGASNRLAAGEGDAQIPELLNALRDREDLILSLEPHLAYVGPAGGFSGVELFKKADLALKGILDKAQIQY